MRTFEEIVNFYAGIEMQDSSHAVSKEDFENEVDFYLESVKRDSYETFLKENLPAEELEEYGLVDIWNAVEEAIKDAHQEKLGK